MLANTPALATANNKQILIGDKNYFGAEFEAQLADGGIELLRRARTGEKPRPGSEFFKPLRQIIESINQTFKGQLDLERHNGRTIGGVCTRVAQRVLGLTIRRLLTAYDH